VKEIVAKISEFSYDIVAFMLPGFAVLLALFGGASFTTLMHATPEQVRHANEGLDWFAHNVWAAAIAIISFSYLFAIWVQHVASNGAWKVRAHDFPFPPRRRTTRRSSLRKQRKVLEVRRWFWKSGRDASLRVFFLRKMDVRLQSYPNELKETLKATAQKMGSSLGYVVDDEKLWPQYYPVARTLARRDKHPSLVQSYQNKYTLARSMAYAVSVWFWIAVLTLALAISEPSLLILLIATAFLSAFVLIRALISQYQYHWKNWGGIVIAETALILSDIEKAPTSSGEERPNEAGEKE
jgi:hypothetical protein